MHTTVETICLRDMERTARLLAAFIESLDDSFADGLAVKDALAAPAASPARQGGA